jgi:hypothetical protein
MQASKQADPPCPLMRSCARTGKLSPRTVDEAVSHVIRRSVTLIGSCWVWRACMCSWHLAAALPRKTSELIGALMLCICCCCVVHAAAVVHSWDALDFLHGEHSALVSVPASAAKVARKHALPSNMQHIQHCHGLLAYSCKRCCEGCHYFASINFCMSLL